MACFGHRLTRRPAFTLVELLVVIAIISILAGLLLPAVNSAREAARKSTCANNMRNIGMAVINFETRYQRFPAAATTTDPNPRQSVYVHLLPFFDETALYDKIDRKEDWDDSSASNNEIYAKGTHIGGILLCPSAPQTREQKAFGEVSMRPAVDMQLTDYSPVYKIKADSQTAPSYSFFEIRPFVDLINSGRVKTDVRGPYVEFDNRPPPKWQGILQNDPVNPVRAASVRDGLSLTFLMFESAGRPESYINGRKNPESQTITAFRWASPDISIQINNTCGNGQIINCHNNGEVYGFHRDGANIVFADGSLHFVSQHIDPETFVSLYTIAGGDVVSESELGL